MRIAPIALTHRPNLANTPDSAEPWLWGGGRWVTYSRRWGWMVVTWNWLLTACFLEHKMYFRSLNDLPSPVALCGDHEPPRHARPSHIPRELTRETGPPLCGSRRGASPPRPDRGERSRPSYQRVSKQSVARFTSRLGPTGQLTRLIRISRSRRWSEGPDAAAVLLVTAHRPTHSPVAARSRARSQCRCGAKPGMQQGPPKDLQALATVRAVVASVRDRIAYPGPSWPA